MFHITMFGTKIDDERFPFIVAGRMRACVSSGDVSSASGGGGGGATICRGNSSSSCFASENVNWVRQSRAAPASASREIGAHVWRLINNGDVECRRNAVQMPRLSRCLSFALSFRLALPGAGQFVTV